MKKERIVFVKDCDNFGEIVAVFPDMEMPDGTLVCYSHAGQHSTCSLRWARGRYRIPTTAGEIIPLYQELTNLVGYSIEVCGKDALPKAA